MGGWISCLPTVLTNLILCHDFVFVGRLISHQLSHTSRVPLCATTVFIISENKCGCSTLRQVYHKSLFIKCRPGNQGSPHTDKKRQQLFSPACCCPKCLGGWLPSNPQWKETIDEERTPTVPCFLCTQCPLRHSPPSSGAFEKTFLFLSLCSFFLFFIS